MKVVGIVQARMASSRLPGKVLMPVLGKPIIIHQLDRILPSQKINELWLATSEESSDDPLALAVERAGYRLFRGSQNDVLERFFHLATRSRADVVVRLTGDCPLHSYELIDYVVGAYLDAVPKFAYASNIHPPTLPDGLDVEVFSYAALKKAANECVEPMEREHVTPGIHGQFREVKPEILNITAPADFSHMRWTLDYQEDFDVIKAIYGALYPSNPMFTWMDILSLMTKDPSLLLHNRREQRNEVFEATLGEYLKKGD
jgi:spore coat polysaccharide biosynthesis protein SpsF